MRDFEKTSLLPVSERSNQYFCSSAYNFLKETCPLYFHGMYRQSGQDEASTRSSVLKLKHPLSNMCFGQIYFSYLTTIVLNSSTELKLSNSLNNFKHKSKEHFFKKPRNMDKINIKLSFSQEQYLQTSLSSHTT